MSDTINGMDAVYSRLKSEVEEISRSFLSMPSGSYILNSLDLIIQVDEDIEMKDIQETPPQKPKALKFVSPRTPNSVVKNSLDFDAFPQTPTLAQLGISDNTLAIVGEGRAKSRLAQMSDTDSEYKISPSSSVALSLGNTIPSTLPLN